MFSMPTDLVWVHFEDGHEQCVEIADYMDGNEAHSLAERFHNYRGHGRIVSVSHRDRKGKVLCAWKIKGV